MNTAHSKALFRWTQLHYHGSKTLSWMREWYIDGNARSKPTPHTLWRKHYIQPHRPHLPKYPTGQCVREYHRTHNVMYFSRSSSQSLYYMPLMTKQHFPCRRDCNTLGGIRQLTPQLYKGMRVYIECPHFAFTKISSHWIGRSWISKRQCPSMSEALHRNVEGSVHIMLSAL